MLSSTWRNCCIWYLNITLLGHIKAAAFSRGRCRSIPVHSYVDVQWRRIRFRGRLKIHLWSCKLFPYSLTPTYKLLLFNFFSCCCALSFNSVGAFTRISQNMSMLDHFWANLVQFASEINSFFPGSCFLRASLPGFLHMILQRAEEPESGKTVDHSGRNQH